mgnify:FL=1
MLTIMSKKNLSRPKAIIFDTDNTLYPYLPAHRAALKLVKLKAVELLGVDEESFMKAFNVSRKEVKDQLGSTASSHSRLLYFQKTIEHLEMGTKIFLTLDLEQTYWREFLANARLFPGVKDFLMQLQKDKVKTANITDLTAQIQFRKMVYFGLDNLFDYVVTSEEAGSDKPSREPFQLALNKLNIDAKDIWVVGDDPQSDISGGKKFGMVTMQMNHSKTRVSEDADVVFKSFQSLYEMYSNL